MTTVVRQEGRAALLAAARAELDEHGHARISLRAVARRAGVSHAAPKHHFPDRAALLTAIAVEGFTALADKLRHVTGSEPANPLAALGHAYIDFALANPALFDLMFRPTELHSEDPALRLAQQHAITQLDTAVRPLPTTEQPAADGPSSLTLISWALAHGLVVLAREGALRPAGRARTRANAAAKAHELAELFSTYLRA
jgi:AcrR family transcriptional regulator